jgi:hypothetical protein
MPRHNRENTPLEKRRAPRGSRTAVAIFGHTTESLEDFQALQAAYGLSAAETYRKALRAACEQIRDTA